MRAVYLQHELIGQIVPVKELKVGDVIAVEKWGDGWTPSPEAMPERIIVCPKTDTMSEYAEFSFQYGISYCSINHNDVVRLLERE